MDNVFVRSNVSINQYENYRIMNMFVDYEFKPNSSDYGLLSFFKYQNSNIWKFNVIIKVSKMMDESDYNNIHIPKKLKIVNDILLMNKKDTVIKSEVNNNNNNIRFIVEKKFFQIDLKEDYTTNNDKYLIQFEKEFTLFNMDWLIIINNDKIQRNSFKFYLFCRTPIVVNAKFHFIINNQVKRVSDSMYYRNSGWCIDFFRNENILDFPFIIDLYIEIMEILSIEEDVNRNKDIVNHMIPLNQKETIELVFNIDKNNKSCGVQKSIFMFKIIPIMFELFCSDSDDDEEFVVVKMIRSFLKSKITSSYHMEYFDEFIDIKCSELKEHQFKFKKKKNIHSNNIKFKFSMEVEELVLINANNGYL